MATYNSPTDVIAGSLAKSSDLNNIDAAIAAAFVLLPANAALNAGTVNFAVDTGTANTYLVALPMTAASYSDGLSVVMRPLNTNTGACTINVDSLGVKSIRNEAGGALVANDIIVGVPVELRYSTTTGYFHCVKSSVASAVAAAADATAAAISAAAASASASSASSSASTATTQAGNASSSASTATTQAGNASSSASTATTQAGNASVSAAAALVSANNAATLYDNFDDRYLGAKASDPTLDNDGNALIAGAMYFNTVSSLMKVYSGSAWLVIGASEVAGDGIDVTFLGGEVTISVDLKANGGLVIESTELALDLGASSITGTLAVGAGGTGRTTGTTAYSLIATGTTATGAQQTLANGLATQILVGGGTGALPVWGTDLPTAVTIGTAYVYRAGGTDVAVADGGTGVGTFTLNGILYGNSATSVLVTAAGTAQGQLLTCGATPFVPAWTTATYPGTTTINQILYSSAANTVSGLATGNSSVLVTNGSGVPSLATDIPTAVTIGTKYIYRAEGTDIPVTDGGTGVSTLTTAYGLLAAGTTATGNVQTLAAGATTQILVGGGTGALPVWGTDLPTAVTIGTAYVYRAGGTDVAVADGGTGVGTFTLNGILYGNSATSVLVTAAGTAQGQLLTCGATPFVPAWTTATYPGTTTINQVLFSSAANTVTGLATGNSSILVTNGSGVPSLATDIPTAVTIGTKYIYRAEGTDVPVTDGGTGVSTMTTAYGLLAAGITATGALQTLAAGATTQILVGGGASALPVWGTDLPTAVTIGGQYITRVGGTDVTVADGGTGASTLALNGVLYGNGTSAIGATAIGAAGQILKVGASPFVPAWTTLVLAEGTNTFNLALGTASLDIAAGATLNIDTSLQNTTGAGVLVWPAAGATLQIPTGGGTLGSAAFTAATAYDVAGAAAAVTPTTLGLVIGTNVQAYNSNLTGINQSLASNSSPSFTAVTTNVTGNCSGSSGTCTGNAHTATHLETARNIGGVSFNGEADITVASATGGFTVTGALTATDNITAYYSDDRLKNRIGNIYDALDSVCSLNGFYYRPNEIAQAYGYKDELNVGLSAQEVDKILHEAIAPAPIDSKYMTIHYDRIIPLLVEAIKELREEIRRLQ